LSLGGRLRLSGREGQELGWVLPCRRARQGRPYRT